MILNLKKLVMTNLSFALPFSRSVRSLIMHQRSKRKIHCLLQENNEICVEVGAGDKKGQNGWITIDITPNCDIFWDLRKGLPFPDGSVTKIYSSHFFEHLSFKESQEFLADCRRAMIPGGRFLICVPNARIYLEAYVSGKDLEPSTYLVYEPAHNHTTRIDYVNYTAYMNGEHKYMFDEENLIYILEMSGFKNAHLRQFDPLIDMHERDYESIYAEAEI